MLSVSVCLNDRADVLGQLFRAVECCQICTQHGHNSPRVGTIYSPLVHVSSPEKWFISATLSKRIQLPLITTHRQRRHDQPEHTPQSEQTLSLYPQL